MDTELYQKYKEDYEKEEQALVAKLKAKKEQAEKLYKKEQLLSKEAEKFIESSVGKLNHSSFEVRFNSSLYGSGIDIEINNTDKTFWSSSSIIGVSYSPLKDLTKNFDYEKLKAFEDELDNVVKSKDNQLLKTFIEKYNKNVDMSQVELSYGSSGGYNSTEKYIDDNGVEQERSIIPRVVSVKREAWDAVDKIIKLENPKYLNELYLKNIIINRQKYKLENEFESLGRNNETMIKNFFSFQMDSMFPKVAGNKVEKEIELFEDNDNHTYEFEVVNLGKTPFSREDLIENSDLTEEEKNSYILEKRLDTTDISLYTQKMKITSEKTEGGKKRFYVSVNDSYDKKSVSKSEAFELMEKARVVDPKLIQAHEELFGNKNGYSIDEKERKQRKQRIDNGFPEHGSPLTLRLFVDAANHLKEKQENDLKAKSKKKKPKM